MNGGTSCLFQADWCWERTTSPQRSVSNHLPRQDSFRFPKFGNNIMTILKSNNNILFRREKLFSRLMSIQTCLKRKCLQLASCAYTAIICVAYL